MFHTPAHKVPAHLPQAGQSYFDPRLALVDLNNPPRTDPRHVEAHNRAVDAAVAYERPFSRIDGLTANSEFRNDRRAYP